MSKKEKAPKEEEKKDAKADEKEKDAKKPEKDAKKPAEGKEGEVPAEGAEGEAPKKSKKKLIIIILAVILVLGGGAGAFLMLSGGDKKETTKDGKKAKDEKDAKLLDKDGKPLPLDKDGNPIKPKPIFFDMPDIIVNLNSPSPRPHFVNLKLTLEVASDAKLEDVKNQLPRITDSFNTYLREVRREDLQGSAGSYRLKKELTLRLNKILGDDVINDILFKEIIVQ